MWRARRILRLSAEDNVETYDRLSRLAKRTPRYTSGTFQFSFGKLRYVDARSLKYQYREIFLHGCYDFFSERDDPLIMDCGGNIGLSVVRFKQNYPRSHVVVFEADPAISEVLGFNLSAQGLKDVKLLKAAAWIRTGQVGWVHDGADSGRVDIAHAQATIESLRVADCITKPVDLLKLDIEGAEYSVIRDLCNTGKIDYVRRLICEIHGRGDDIRNLGPLMKDPTDRGFSLTFPFARSAPDLVGAIEPTPFSAVRDGKFLLHLYAWQSRGDACFPSKHQ
jgi:FkbM family methyltransferase